MSADHQPGSFAIWMQAARPRTLPLSFSGIITGSALAYAVGAFKPSIFISALTTTLLLQLLSNFANDLGDAVKGADQDSRIGPQRVMQAGLLSVVKMRRAIMTLATLAFLSGLTLLYFAFGSEQLALFTLFLVIGLAAIGAAINYTMGKRPYGYSGLGDLFVMIFFGFVSVNGTYFLFTGSLSVDSLVQSVVLGCFATAVLHLNNMRDRDEDQLAGKNTLAVKLGPEQSKAYFYVLILLLNAGAIWYGFTREIHITSWLFLLALVPSWIICLKIYQISDRHEFNIYLKPTALSAFFYAILFFIGQLL